MATDLLYLRDAYLRDVRRHGRRRCDGDRVALDRTAFYPTGGGQPHDTGRSLGRRRGRVVDVRKDGDAVVAPPRRDDAAAGRRRASHGEIDWDRRHALMRTHTALHVLCGVIWNEWRVPVTGGNMEPLSARMDFEFDPLPEGFGPRVEELVNAELAADRPIEVSFLPASVAVLDEDLIRTKVSLIPESVTEIRVVDIVGLDKQADGGTHVRSTAEVGPHPGREDRVEGQGQQAHPPRGRRCLTPRSSRCERLRPSSRSVGGGRVLAAAPTPRSSRGWPTTPSGPTRALAVTAVSPSLAAAERDDCAALAAEWGLRWQEVETDELDNPAYARNDGDRCYWCKDALMDAARPARRRRAGATVVLGVNLDDLGDHRPGPARGRRARRGVPAGRRRVHQGRRARTWSKELGLRDVGQAGRRLPRVPAAVRHARHARAARLGRAGRGGAARPGLPRAARAPLRRGRPHRGAARRPRRRSSAAREAVVAAVEAAGYRWVTLDLAGLRSGGFNQLLGP